MKALSSESDVMNDTSVKCPSSLLLKPTIRSPLQIDALIIGYWVFGSYGTVYSLLFFLNMVY